MSLAKKSRQRNVTRSDTPARYAFSLLWLMRLASSSMPTPRAPNTWAAATTSRPSPLPRSYTTSLDVTSARRSIWRPTGPGVTTYGLLGLTNPGPPVRHPTPSTLASNRGGATAIIVRRFTSSATSFPDAASRARPWTVWRRGVTLRLSPAARRADEASAVRHEFRADFRDDHTDPGAADESVRFRPGGIAGHRGRLACAARIHPEGGVG